VQPLTILDTPPLPFWPFAYQSDHRAENDVCYFRVGFSPPKDDNINGFADLLGSQAFVRELAPTS